MKKIFLLFWGVLITLFCPAQEKELLIIGTMHTVPAIVKNSYKPLLNYAAKYEPEAIYVEYIHPESRHGCFFQVGSKSKREERSMGLGCEEVSAKRREVSPSDWRAADALFYLFLEVGWVCMGVKEETVTVFISLAWFTDFHLQFAKH